MPRKATSKVDRKPRSVARKSATVSDEGESQSNYLMPAEGGTYIRQPGGNLKRIEHPTRPASLVNEETAKAMTKRGRKAAAQDEPTEQPADLVPVPDQMPPAAKE